MDILKIKRGRKPTFLNDDDLKLKQQKRQQYYINFRNKHEQNNTTPLYYRKNTPLGRPKKELKPITETKPNVLHKMIDEIIIKLQELKTSEV